MAIEAHFETLWAVASALKSHQSQRTTQHFLKLRSNLEGALKLELILAQAFRPQSPKVHSKLPMLQHVISRHFGKEYP